ncbi:MAG: hypothetical protein ACE5G0_01290 [Rhodothermales bacterium]
MLALILLLLGGGTPARAQAHEEGEEEHSESRFSDEPIPLADIPKRPRPLIELGEPFLGTGTLSQGIRLPTGAVWQPAFLAFGTLRSAAQGIDNGVDDARFVEAAARFDLFGNLYLTQTERVLIGFRPLDQDGRFTRFTLSADPALPDSLDDFQDELNFGIRTLFFEGDLGELFPALDWDDSGGLDYGLSVGRQPLSFQDGLLINEDAIDAVGLTRANVRLGSLVNVRITGLFAWGDIDRPAAGGNAGDKSAWLVGLFTETDSRTRTVELDALYVSADDETGDGLYVGLGTTRRLGRYSNTLRVLASFPVGDETVANRQGILFHNQLSWTPHHTHNHVYINGFLGVGEFRSAARSPSAGGPLGRTGILFAAVGLGRYGAALSNQADRAFGGSAGYQMFFDHTRKQLVIEVGGRSTYGDAPPASRDALAVGARFQMAFGRRGVIVLDGFGSYDFDGLDPGGNNSDLSFGGRVEVVIKL